MDCQTKTFYRYPTIGCGGNPSSPLNIPDNIGVCSNLEPDIVANQTSFPGLPTLAFNYFGIPTRMGSLAYLCETVDLANFIRAKRFDGTCAAPGQSRGFILVPLNTCITNLVAKERELFPPFSWKLTRAGDIVTVRKWGSIGAPDANCEANDPTTTEVGSITFNISAGLGRKQCKDSSYFNDETSSSVEAVEGKQLFKEKLKYVLILFFKKKIVGEVTTSDLTGASTQIMHSLNILMTVMIITFI